MVAMNIRFKGVSTSGIPIYRSSGWLSYSQKKGGPLTFILSRSSLISFSYRWNPTWIAAVTRLSINYLLYKPSPILSKVTDDWMTLFDIVMILFMKIEKNGNFELLIHAIRKLIPMRLKPRLEITDNNRRKTGNSYHLCGTSLLLAKHTA